MISKNYFTKGFMIMDHVLQNKGHYITFHIDFFKDSRRKLTFTLNIYLDLAEKCRFYFGNV